MAKHSCVADAQFFKKDHLTGWIPIVHDWRCFVLWELLPRLNLNTWCIDLLWSHQWVILRTESIVRITPTSHMQLH
eukprot:879405-Amphidinium_carterae.2